MSGPHSHATARSKLPRALILSGLGFALITGLLVSHHHFQGQAENKLAKSVAAIRAAGMPTSAVELDAWYVEPPVNQNAAVHYVQAFNQMVGISIGNPWFDSQSRNNILNPTNPIPSLARLELQGYITTNQAALALIYDGGKLSAARYPVGLTGGHNVHLDHLPRVRNAIRLCNLEALNHALDDRSDAAIVSLMESLKLGHSLSQEPTIISCLVQISGYVTTAQMLENILNRTNLPSPLTERLRSELDRAEKSIHLDRALAGERSMSLDFFQDPVAFTGGAKPALGQSMLASLYEMSGIKQKDISAFIHLMERSVDASKKPPEEITAAFREVEDEFMRLSTERTWSMVITRMLIPALFKSGVRNVEAKARLRLGQLALAINEYQSANSGKLPDSLSSLSITIMDPGDGKPLRYRRTPTGYELWSVGPDGVDQGGKAKSKGSPSEAYDIVFKVEPPVMP